MSSGIAKASANVKRSFDGMKNKADELVNHNKKIGDSYDSIVSKAGSAFSKIGGFLKGAGIAGLIAGAVAGGSAFGFVKDAVTEGAKKYAEFEATNKSFEVLTGNRAVGKGLAADLQNLQQETVLGPEVFKNAQTMLGFGIQADKIIPTLKMLGDVSMGDADKLQSLTLAFSQVQAAGKLTGQDLLQFINAGFNPLNEIARTTGKSMGSLKKDMEAGKITFDMVQKSFETATGKGGRYNDMMNQIAQTRKSQMAQLEGQMEANLIAIGEKWGWVTEIGTQFKATMLDLIAPHKKLQDSIITEKAEINTLVGAITNVNTSNEARLALINRLKTTYPDIFGAIDAEKIKNGELLEMLKNVNQEYEKKIGLATRQQKVNDLQEEYNNKFKALIDDTLYAEKDGESKKWYWDERLAERKKQFESVAWDLQRAQSDLDTGKIVDRIKNVMSFADNADSMKAFSGRSKDRTSFMSLVNKWKSGGLSAGMSVADLERAEKLMSPSKIASGAGGSGTSTTSETDKIGRSVTGGGPRVINIHGVKFMDTLNIYSSDIKGGEDELEKRLQDMLIRILNSGAAVQS